MSPSRDSLSWFADTVRPISCAAQAGRNFHANQALELKPSQENSNGSWNIVVDAGCADSGHSIAGHVLTSLS